MLTAVVCPISNEKIDSRLSRVTALLNVLLMLVYVLTLNPLLLAIVVIDYLIRGFLNVKLSPIRLVALGIKKLVGFSEKPTNLAPKIFASRLGFVFSLAGLVLYFYGYSTASVGAIIFLMILSSLDVVFDFCVGCLVYNYLIFPFCNKRQKV